MEEFNVSIKTKIATYIMMVVGSFFFLGFFAGLIVSLSSGYWIQWQNIIVLVVLFIYSFFFLFFPIYVLRKKRWAWYGSIIELFLFVLPVFSSFITRFFIRHSDGDFLLNIAMIEIVPGVSFGGILPSNSLNVSLSLLCILALIFFFIDKQNYWKISQ